MKISLIGMSGVGKTHWSKRLEQSGFIRFCVDDIIQNKLKKELQTRGFSDINDVSVWMGQPYDKRYQENSQKYLQFEKDSINEILAQIKKLDENTNVVIDTTGSMIYHGTDSMKSLSKFTKIIHLNTPSTIQEEMCKLYFKDPKPVIWGHIYQKNNDENNTEALINCYPKLLEYRLRKYKKYADIEIDYHTLRKLKFNVKDFLKLIK